MLRVCVLLTVTSFVCGCAEPLPPPAKAAARIDLSECGSLAGVSAVPNERDVRLNLQNSVVDLDSFPYAVDGEGGADVQCSMVESSPGTFTLDAEAKAGSTFFAVKGTIAAGFGANASISWFDSATFTNTISSQTCSLTLIQQSDTGDGALIGFDCPGMRNASTPDVVCKGAGTFIVDRCDK
jgi:hypothetical protein